MVGRRGKQDCALVQMCPVKNGRWKADWVSQSADRVADRLGVCGRHDPHLAVGDCYAPPLPPPAHVAGQHKAHTPRCPDPGPEPSLLLHHGCLATLADVSMQVPVIRVLWMVPIYAVDSWLALRFSMTLYRDISIVHTPPSPLLRPPSHPLHATCLQIGHHNQTLDPNHKS